MTCSDKNGYGSAGGADMADNEHDAGGALICGALGSIAAMRQAEHGMLA